MGVLAAGVGEVDADMGLEGALVRREAGVAVYPKPYRSPAFRNSKEGGTIEEFKRTKATFKRHGTPVVYEVNKAIFRRQ